MLSHEQATVECIAEAQKLGRFLARQVINRVLLLGLTPSDVEDEVDCAIEDVRGNFLTDGADGEDIKAILSVIKIALAEEGARLSLLTTFEAGTA